MSYAMAGSREGVWRGVGWVNCLTGGGGGQVFQNMTPRLETIKDTCHARVNPLINLAGELLTCLGVRVRAGHAGGGGPNTGEEAKHLSHTHSHTRRFVCYVVTTLDHNTEGHLADHEHV